MRVSVDGAGVAVRTAAHLLGSQGLTVSCEGTARRPVPALLLSDTALDLLRDIFKRPALFADRPRIMRRVVAWGAASRP